jgi:hypothetical protein
MRLRGRQALIGLLALTCVFALMDGGKGRSQQQAVPEFLQKIQGPGGKPAFSSSELVREFLVTPEVGPWMICVASYTGPEAAQMAREFVLVLRDPKGPYKLPAYVFNRGDEERQKELKHREEVKRQKIEWFKERGLPVPEKIRVPKMNIEEQCAVLIGGFKDIKAARRFLDVIKKFDTPDPTKVKMDSAFIADVKNKKAEGTWINPFKHAFVVPNPSIPQQAANANAAPDPFLKELNATEPYSLLKCPRACTLLVKQFQGATMVQPEAGGVGILGKAGAGKGGLTGATLDYAGQSARNLAELLHNKLKVDEVYVLHTRYNSMVTVGSFDNDKDPRLQRALENWSRLLQRLPPQTVGQLQLITQPVPMIIPRPK